MSNIKQMKFNLYFSLKEWSSVFGDEVASGSRREARHAPCRPDITASAILHGPQSALNILINLYLT